MCAEAGVDKNGCDKAESLEQRRITSLLHVRQEIREIKLCFDLFLGGWYSSSRVKVTLEEDGCVSAGLI